ncbi:MAG: vitamin B12/bleomycin/antimicrobial peptide transport system ATP-binding/permease protein [Actinomycetota bacterium]|jgi:putative ATP-binding cassette transporter|nr:vitamin B12/bleomycin/antimicrobial peptide transport system ATP-binding/permease protein [Actinomycetota bacterium]HPY25881.1 ABC transporter ATP-binding protein/permease [Mycobacterium sp.]
MEMYEPSLDWANELTHSLLWAAKAWAITAPLTVIVLVLLARYTAWGRQFWRVTGGYFRGRDSVRVWAWLGVLLFSTLVAVRLDVLLSYFSNDLYSSLQVAFAGAGAGNDAVRDSGINGFWAAIVTFMLIVVLYISRQLIDIYLTQRFIIRWRVWLTERLTADWLDGEAFYRGRFLDAPIDNPDQRIQLDIDAFTAFTGQGPNVPSLGTIATLPFGAINSMVSVVAFTPILWSLSGELIFFGITIDHALFWIAVVYVFATTVVAFWIGHPLIRFSFRNELTNAAFRYALVRLRDAAESISFYRGEEAEKSLLRKRFSAIIDNYRGYVVRNLALLGWNNAISQLINPLPLMVQAQRLFKGQISFGDVTQSATAFSAVHDSLSYFRAVYDSFAAYRATIIRLDGLVESDRESRELPRLTAEDSPDGALELRDVEVRNPSGSQLIESLSLRLEPGDSLVITGPSGCGRTTLLRSIALLWPYATGTVRHPDHGGDAMFLSQVPYLPLGDLRAVLSYPSRETGIADDRLTAALEDVTLGHLSNRLNETQDWSKTLSPGEQQRIAFARVLLHQPKVIYFDESTSALDPGNEYALYRLVTTRLPGSILVSVTHRDSVKQHHNFHLHLTGDGGWTFKPEPASADV